jgi:hypothetical protein
VCRAAAALLGASACLAGCHDWPRRGKKCMAARGKKFNGDNDHFMYYMNA